MRLRHLSPLIVLALWQSPALAQCAPAHDSPYFFRGLAEQRAEAKIAENHAFYDELLSDTFVTKGRDGKSVDKHAFIADEFAVSQVAPQKHFFAIRDFSLVEHRKGFVVSSYVLTEGTTGGGETHVKESSMREVYQVEDGKWRLASVETVAPQTAQP
jgi:hypothetical protein